MFNKCKELIEKGFPIEQLVLRIDPIIPTEKGTQTAINVITLFKELNIKRIRISFLDMYKHVKERFIKKNIPLPYSSFHSDICIRMNIVNKLQKLGKEYGFVLEVCGEPGINSVPCLSQRDIDILDLTNKIILVGNARQRKSCSCPMNKKELIINGFNKKCGNECLYCYIKN